MSEKRKKRRTKYQKAGIGMRKFAVKPGVYYSFSPIKQFNSKAKAKIWIKSDKKTSPLGRHRIVKNPIKRKGTIKEKRGKYKKNYSVYRTFYP